MEYELNSETYIDGEPPQLLTIADLAHMLNISTYTLRKWRRTGNHPLMNDLAIAPGPRSPRWRRADVEEYIKNL